MYPSIRSAAGLVVTLLGASVGSLGAQQVTALQVPTGTLRLDGVLADAAWNGPAAATEFTQRQPAEGAAASERTEVRFAYDDDALWIGARMFSANPGAIQALMTRRDREVVSEQLVVSLDTYRDRRTAYSFAVTPSGVRSDYYHAGDCEDCHDTGWDPVWEVETRIDELGWTAELRIPFTQLRFTDAAVQSWGVNLVRHIPERNEASYWVLVRRDETGWSSRMGELAGISGVRRSRGIEALPYVVGSAALADVADPDDPFLEDRSLGVRAGGDLKVQLGSALTLDATFNPDFGQVEADPAEVNLTAFETFFGERRPFFVENSSLFGQRGFFYSRRIGGPPLIAPDADHFEALDNTTILGAAKLTGRLPSGVAVGALAALTDEEEVETYDEPTRAFGRAAVAPRTGYAVASVQQQFGPDASTLTGMVTGVRRNLEPGSPLAAAVAQTAFSGLLDLRLRWGGGGYDVVGWLGGTHVRGSPEALLALQRSSRRYWQRPDAGHVEVDPTRTTMSGTTMGIAHSKMAGDWLWDIDLVRESPGFDPNDAGQLGSTDDRSLVTNLRYRETVPGRWLRDWSLGVFQVTEWNFDGDRGNTVIQPGLNATLLNFWRVNLAVGRLLGGLSDAQTRGGPLMRMPSLWESSFSLRNAESARTSWGVQGVGGRDEAGGRWLRLNPSLGLRPGAAWELTIEPRWNGRVESRQYVTEIADGPASTFGRRYVFAKVDRSEIAAGVRLNYTFTPNLTLESYLEPFASSGTYHGFGELAAPGSGDLRVYGTGGTTIARNANGTRTVSADGRTFTLPERDFNVRSLRSNLVLRWEWRPGSTAYLVWQQDGSADREPGSVGPGDLVDAFGASPDQFLAIKLSYWLPLR